MFKLFNYTISGKGQQLIDQIEALWVTLNALPGFNADLYLEDLSEDEDLLDMDHISNIIQGQGVVSPNYPRLLQDQLSEGFLDNLVQRGLLNKQELEM